jgi:putative peptidoglycan lipid II flippase
VLNALLVVTGVLVVAGIVFAPPLIGVYAGDFASVPGKLELTVQLTRVVLPFLTMVAIARPRWGC